MKRAIHIRKRSVGSLLAALSLLLVLVALPAAAQDTAVSIALGDVVSGSLSLESPTGRYVLLTPGSQSVAVQVLATTPGLQPQFRVIDAAGQVVRSVENTTGQSVVQGNIYLAAAGQYLLEVQSASGIAGTFVVALQEGPPVEPPVPLAVGESVETTVDSQTSLRTYTFSPLLEEAVFLNVHSLRPDIGPLVRLRDGETGDALGAISTRVTGVRFRVPMGSGNYRVEVAHGGSPGAEPYVVCLESESGSITCQAGAPASVPTGTPTLTPLVAPTQPPVPAPPTSSQCTVSAASATVNVRTGPGLEYPIVSSLSTTANALVIGRSADAAWWQINLGGIVGWVSAPFVVVQGDCFSVPFAAAPPTPVPSATPVTPSATVPGPTDTPTYTPTATQTPTPSYTPTDTPTPTVTNTPGGGFVITIIPPLVTLNPGIVLTLRPPLDFDPIFPGP